MHLPGPLRATVGLVASAATEVKRLPDRAIELPMLAVSTALQASLRAQQRYARLTARGDEVLNRRTPTQEPPPWATFDEPVPVDPSRGTVFGRGDENGAGPEGAARSKLDNLFGAQDPTVPADGREPVGEVPTFDEGAPVEVPTRPADTAAEPANSAGRSMSTKEPGTGARTSAKEQTGGMRTDATRAGTKRTTTQKTAKKATKKRAAAKRSTKSQTAAKQAPKPAASPATKRTSVKSAAATQKAAKQRDDGAAAKPAGPTGSKNVSKPRHTPPSAFDNVADIGG